MKKGGKTFGARMIRGFQSAEIKSTIIVHKARPKPFWKIYPLEIPKKIKDFELLIRDLTSDVKFENVCLSVIKPVGITDRTSPPFSQPGHIRFFKQFGPQILPLFNTTV